MIRIQSLRKTLNGDRVLDGVSLTVRKGETVALLGPSGTGKSVLLKHVVGLFDPDSGDVRVDGTSVPRADAAEVAEVRARIGYLFQSAALFDSLSVAENIRMGLEGSPRGPWSDREARAVRRSLRRLNLEPGVLDLLPSELSGGMEKRVALARALAGEHDYILYDEPTTGLDPVNTSLTRELIERLHEEQDALTDVLVTHDIDLAFSLADRALVLEGGRVRARGTPEELRQSSDAFVRRFLNGSSRPVSGVA